jgi:hypothetical protein
MTWGSSLFWFVLLVTGAATVLAKFGKLTGDNWMAVALVALGAFGVRKVVEELGNPPSAAVPYVSWSSTQLWLCGFVVVLATWLSGIGVVSGVNWMAVAMAALAALGVRSAIAHRNDSAGV